MRQFLLALLLIAPFPALAQEHGNLRFFDSETNFYTDASGIATELDINVSGTIARVRSIQYFYNQTDQWQEGVYTWPLPEKAAVDRLVMVIGEQKILGFIAEKEKARKIYEQARQTGKATALVEQHSTNIFRTSVANIPPRSLIAIETGYQTDIAIDGHDFELRVPMAVTPRYDRFGPEEISSLASASPENSRTRELAERIALFDFESGESPFSLRVALDPGFEVTNLLSRSHDVTATKNDSVYRITPATTILPGKQDFVLNWQAPESNYPLAFLHSEITGDGQTFSHLTVLPPSATPGNTKAPPRQITMIIDTSGSMSGPSIVQAKTALKEAVADLDARDRFNIIRFSSDMQSLFNQSVPATPDNRATALSWVDKLGADGGTEMMPPVRAALAEFHEPGFLRQVIFITDGAISYGSELGSYIREHVGGARFFAIGIGAAPNAELMSTIAAHGRGTFTFIGDIHDTREKMAAIFQKMKHPALINLSLAVPGESDIEILPGHLPDLLHGEPISVVIRSASALNHIALSGSKSGQEWNVTLTPSALETQGIGKLYARRKIADITLSDPLFQQAENQREVVRVALEHQIISRFTSLVAVDEKILRPQEEKLFSRRINPNTPEGWQLADFDPHKAALRYQDILNEKKADDLEQSSRHDLDLPKTASGWEVSLMAALVLLGIGLLMRGKRYAA